MESCYEIRKLEELVNVKGGKRLPKGEPYSVVPTQHPYLRVCDFSDGSISEENLCFLTEETHLKISRYTISDEDVYISIAGTLGLSGVIPKHLSGANLTENAAKLVVRDKDILDKEYLALFLNSVGQREIERQAKATSQPKLALFRIEQIQIPLPPIAEQRRIAAILDKADAVRRKRKEAISLTEELLRSTFLDMFGDPIKNPKGWDVKPLGKIATFVGGGTPSRKISRYFEGNICWATSKDMGVDILVDTQEHVTEEAIENSATKLISLECLLVVVKSKVLMKRLPVARTEVPVCFGQDLKAIIPSETWMTRYLQRHMKLGQQVLLQQARGANTEGLTLEHLRRYPVMMPPKEVVQRFAKLEKFLKQAKSQRQASNQQSNLLFNSLLQRAFRGDL